MNKIVTFFLTIMCCIIVPLRALHRAAQVVPASAMVSVVPSAGAGIVQGERKMAFAAETAPDKKRQTFLIDALQEHGLPSPLCRLMSAYEEYVPAGPECYPFLVQSRIKRRLNDYIIRLAFTGNSLATQAHDGKVMVFDCATGAYQKTLKSMPDCHPWQDVFPEKGYITLTDDEDDPGIALTKKIAQGLMSFFEDSRRDHCCRDFLWVTREPMAFLTLGYDDSVSYHFALAGPEGAKFMSGVQTLATGMPALTAAIVPKKGLFFVVFSGFSGRIRSYQQQDIFGNVTAQDKQSFHSNQNCPIDLMNATEGGLLATVNRARELVVQNYVEERLLIRLVLPALPSVIKLSEDGATLAVGYGGGCIELYTLDAGEAIAGFGKLSENEVAIARQLADSKLESLTTEEFNKIVGGCTPAMRDLMLNAYEFLVKDWFLPKPALATGCSCLIQ